MLRIAVCDDEKVFQEKLSGLIRQILKKAGGDCEIRMFSSGEELIEYYRKNVNLDILFLDVNMKGIDGLEVAKIIRMYASDVYIIFVTAFLTYALEGYKVNAERYLLKTGENFADALKECLDSILKKMNYKEQSVVLDFQSGRKELSVDRILYVESQLHKSIFRVLENGVKEYYMYAKLDHVQEILSNRKLMRVHQSFIVNLNHVESLERYVAVLSDGSRIRISKKYYKAAETEFVRLKGEI